MLHLRKHKGPLTAWKLGWVLITGEWKMHFERSLKGGLWKMQQGTQSRRRARSCGSDVRGGLRAGAELGPAALMSQGALDLRITREVMPSGAL